MARLAPTPGTPQPNAELSTPDSVRIYVMPPAPEDFGEAGISHWKHYCGVYLKLGNLSSAWIPAIVNICRLFDYLHVIQQALDEEGTMIIKWQKDSDGDMQPNRVMNPLLRDFVKITKDIHMMLNDMGMTPYSSKVSQFNMNSSGDLSPIGKKPAITRPATPQNTPV